MNRRRFLGLLWALLGMAWASPEEPKKEKKDKDEKESKEKEPKDFSTRLYGEVLAARGGQVKVGAYVLQGDSPWLAWVAPGMWVEAEGWKAGERFFVQHLRILKPERFTYYRGPGAPVGVSFPFVEAWYRPGEESPFFLQAAPSGETVLLVAYAEAQGVLAQPRGLALPTPPGPGWFLARGRWEGERIRWLKMEALRP